MINTLQLARHAGYVIAFACVDPDDLMIATIQAAGGVDDFLKELFAEMISESCIGSVQIFCFFGSPNFCPFAVDHHLTTTVQRHYKMPEKPVVTTNNGLFPVLGATVQSQQNSRFNVGLYRLVVVLRQLRHGRFLTLFCAMQRDLCPKKRGGQRWSDHELTTIGN